MTLRILLLFSLIGFGWLQSSFAAPNVIMIISDDHAWTDYGFMGHPFVRTPNLDRLANESRCFQRGYVTSSLCCPSLATIMTGRYPHQHKITSNDPPVPPGMSAREFNQSPLFQQGRDVMNQHMEKVPTMSRLLRDQGYLCLQTGKWWQGHFSHGGFTHGMTKGGRHGDEGLDIGRKTMQPIYDHIQLAKSEAKPFFIWYAPMMPHDPHTPPDRLLDHYRNKTDSIHVAKYFAMVEWFDETIGDILNHLDQQQIAEETIIVYVADNGWITNPTTGRYAPKSKQSQYDGGLRSPIMIRHKNHIQPAMHPSLAQSIDFLPTILQAINHPESAKLGPTLPGINLLDDSALNRRTAIFGECFTHNAVDLNEPSKNLRYRWMIEGNSKLIVPDLTNEPNAEIELYDLNNDPHEEKNLANLQTTQVTELQPKIDRWWKP
jgi:arylsulfatase A-like enzyme